MAAAERGGSLVYVLENPKETREIIIYTKTKNGKAAGDTLSVREELGSCFKELRETVKRTLKDYVGCQSSELIVDKLYFIRKGSKQLAVTSIVNDSGVSQALTDYPLRQKNGHLSTAPLRLAADWHLKGAATPTRSSPRIERMHVEITAGVNIKNNTADGPVYTLTGVELSIKLDTLKKLIKQNVKDACIMAGLYWLQPKGKQIHVLLTDNDLEAAKESHGQSEGILKRIRLAVVVQSDSQRSKGVKRKLISTSSENDPDSDTEAYEKFVKNSKPEEKLKEKNKDWNSAYVDLRRYIEKNGTLSRFGISHLSLWTDLIIEGSLAGPEEEPNWTKYRHIVQVDPLPKRGAGATRATATASSSSSMQDLLSIMLLQQQQRREEEMRWREMDMRKQDRQNDMLSHLFASHRPNTDYSAPKPDTRQTETKS